MKLYSTKEIKKLENSLKKLENLYASFDYLKISIASPDRIKSWAYRFLPTSKRSGEVLLPETINFRTHKPEFRGLFCEMIFGPIKNWKCHCAKYHGLSIDKINRICETCNVEITESRVRRYRMGYIELSCPIVHYWYFKGVPNYLSILLKPFCLKMNDIEQIIYFKEGAKIIDRENALYCFFSEKTDLEKLFVKKLILNKTNKYTRNNSVESIKLNELVNQKRKGAEIIKSALEDIDLILEIETTRDSLEGKEYNSISERKMLIRRIRILENFLSTKTDPGWMVLTVLPVLPPSLRPLVELENGKLVAADINEIYRIILIRNQRLFDFLYNCGAPDFISVYARKLLQESIDSLIDNARLPKNKMISLNKKPLKSLTEILEGKQGRFRQSLLGKRVDYSGRSVIIVNPNLRLNQCGLPYEMASELFQPFLINELLKTKIQPPSYNTKLARLIIKKNKPFIWTLLERLTRKHCILLNRAPTLHRFGIQAFDPLIVLGQAIHLHPLVCTGFNADFDGDQMAVHLPLYQSSQIEAKSMMRPSYNVVSPSNGEVILKPTQDMVIGSYYLTLMLYKNESFLRQWFGNEVEALKAYYKKIISLHTPILVRYSLKDFLIKIDNSFIYIKSKLSYTAKYEKLIIYKKYQNKEKFYFFITNLGILTAEYFSKNNYEISDLFLETTIGRLIFSLNIKTLVSKNESIKQ
jgi:DNA-directed RNA polymerase subunit beta'